MDKAGILKLGTQLNSPLREDTTSFSAPRDVIKDFASIIKMWAEFDPDASVWVLVSALKTMGVASARQALLDILQERGSGKCTCKIIVTNSYMYQINNCCGDFYDIKHVILTERMFA